MKEFVCLNCGNLDHDLPNRIKKRKYCSLKCFYTSKEHLENLKIRNLGRHHSEETKRKMSESKKRELHPFFGKLRPLKTKIKMNLTRRKNKLAHSIDIRCNPTLVGKKEIKGGIRNFRCIYYDRCLNVVINLSSYTYNNLKTKTKWNDGFSCINCQLNSMK